MVSGLIHCPHQVAVLFREGQVVHFPADVCASCHYVSAVLPVKLDVAFPSILMNPCCRSCASVKQQPRAGRAKLRQRVSVEHTLAHIGRWQGRSARYIGSRRHLFDLRRMAVVHNLHVIATMPELAVDAAA